MSFYRNSVEPSLSLLKTSSYNTTPTNKENLLQRNDPQSSYEDQPMDITDFPKNIATAFFKCTRWLVEETGDESSCAYHYSCDSTYPDDYAPVVDLLVILFAISVYATTASFLLLGATNAANTPRRYLLPSGPVALPAILFILAKGSRINTLFPISITGPAVLHLLHVSALSFRYELSAIRSVKYAVLEASTVSGVLHASLYLDSVVVPYYTGLDALGRSAFSGECATCVCRAEALAVGGMVSYRAWSRTTAAVVGTLCLRMLSRALGEERSRASARLEKVAEGLSWVLITADVAYVAAVVPRGENGVVTSASYGGVLVLIFISVSRKVAGFLVRKVRNDQCQKNVYLCKSNVEIP